VPGSNGGSGARNSRRGGDLIFSDADVLWLAESREPIEVP
jgi:hypothetical protein